MDFYFVIPAKAGIQTIHPPDTDFRRYPVGGGCAPICGPIPFISLMNQ
ncbi:hypothetical protein MICA_2289 [Micavibrio aeruginosavorus ARL-13]|uniref:Uncharacterized protein n=1 Tax=Micavibrio aeruginosavorus (strain ARL-13) TaxID=856793 RepID=G2KT48_MICAA|nr:hypothetical protein MICA_2289 [Micavibrio aeruginosavorus ARL-13]